MLQGIENALSAVKYGGDGYAVGNILFEGVTGYFGQAVPTALGQVARTIDGTRRTTYTESGAPLASGSRFIQRLPIKERQLIAFVPDSEMCTNGEEKKRQRVSHGVSSITLFLPVIPRLMKLLRWRKN